MQKLELYDDSECYDLSIDATIFLATNGYGVRSIGEIGFSMVVGGPTIKIYVGTPKSGCYLCMNDKGNFNIIKN